MSELAELQQDLKELQELLVQAHRKANQNFITQRIKIIEGQIEQLTPKRVEQPIQNVLDQDEGIFLGITKYAWDQEGKKVKIFLNLEGVGQVAKENITWAFGEQTVDVKIKGYKGANHRYSIKKTFDPIVPKESTLKITNNSVVLTLTKKESKTWDQLHFKEKLLNADKFEKEDPQASLMNMMKEMYQNGDEDMKRTIAQAWTKSQDEKQKMGL